MFNTYIKNYQTKYLSKTWLQVLRKREVKKNNYRVSGSIKKAKAFVRMVNNFTFETDFAKLGEQIIFSSDSLVAPLLLPTFLYADN